MTAPAQGTGASPAGVRDHDVIDFLVARTGEILRMPGLPQHPPATTIDLRDGEIFGL